MITYQPEWKYNGKWEPFFGPKKSVKLAQRQIDILGLPYKGRKFQITRVTREVVKPNEVR